MIAWAYCRFSSENQREESIDAQVRAIEEYCKREGFDLERVYKDEARSATTDNRPEFQRMFKDIETDPCDCVIVHKLDRFSRDRYDSALYKRKLRLKDIRLISVLENIDGSPESIILESVLEGFAEYYSKNLAREVMKGLRENAYQCRHTGGLPPLGYDVAPDGSYIINEVEASWVQKAFELKAAGNGYTTIARILNEMGARTKRGGMFNKNSFHDLFRNEKYKGVYVFNRAASKRGGKRNNHASKSAADMIKIEDGMPRIIDDNLWDSVNGAMDDRKNNARGKANRIYLLSGIIFCGECDSPMSGNTRRSGRNKTLYSTYECNRRKREKTCKAKGINCEYVENLVIDYLHDEFFTDENIRRVAAALYEYQMEDHSAADATETEDLEKRLAKAKRELDHIVATISEKGATDWLYDRGNDLQDEINMYENRLYVLKRKPQRMQLTEKQMYDYMMEHASIRNMDRVHQKEIIQSYVEKVVVFEDHIDVHLYIDKNDPGRGGRDCGYDGGDEVQRTPVRLHHKAAGQTDTCAGVRQKTGTEHSQR